MVKQFIFFLALAIIVILLVDSVVSSAYNKRFNFFLALAIFVILLVVSVVPAAAYTPECKLTNIGFTDVYGNFHDLTSYDFSKYVLGYDTQLVYVQRNIPIGAYDDNKEYYTEPCDRYTFVAYPSGHYQFRQGSHGGSVRFFLFENEKAMGVFSYLEVNVSCNTGNVFSVSGKSASSTFTYVSYGSFSDDLDTNKNRLLESDLLYVTSDIVDSSDPDSLFFHPTEPAILVTAVAPVRMDLVLQEVLKMTPIGLACLAGFAALRKGLALLRRILYQA